MNLYCVLFKILIESNQKTFYIRRINFDNHLDNIFLYYNYKLNNNFINFDK